MPGGRPKQPQDPSKAGVSGQANIPQERKDPKHKPKVVKKKFHCDLCNRSFVDIDALRMHAKKSTAHTKSQHDVCTAKSTRTPQTVSPSNLSQVMKSITISNQSKQPKLANKDISCIPCNRIFEAEEAYQMHIQNSSRHKNRDRSDQGASGRQIRGPTSTIQPFPSRDTATPNFALAEGSDQLWCSICHRQFQNENGYRNHLATSKEHKVNTDRLSNPKSGNNILPATTIVSQPLALIQPPQNFDSLPATTHTAPVNPLLRLPDHILASLIPSSNLAHVPGESRSNVGGLSLGHSQSWSEVPISIQKFVLEALKRKCHRSGALLKSGYRLQETNSEIGDRRKCWNCRGLKRDLDKRPHGACIFHPKGRRIEKGDEKQSSKRVCSKCGEKGEGCIVLSSHQFPPVARRAEDYMRTPSSLGKPAKRAAVALDCEMVGIKGGYSEAVQLCAVDFITGEVLVDTYVVPDQQVTSWRSKVSGVNRALLADMVNQRRTVNGWKEARQALWNHIDEATVLIGQALSNDLDVLRMVHFQIVDSAILTREAVNPNCARSWGLKVLCQELLGKTIQDGTSGHYCLEDAFAAREVVLFCLQHPDRLEMWAQVQRDLIQKIRAEKEAAERRKAEEEAAKVGAKATILSASLDSSDAYDYEDYEDDFDVDEVLLFGGRHHLGHNYY